MRVLFAGTPDVAVTALDALADSGHEVAAVLTQPPARRGRSRTLQPSPVAAWAAQRSVPILDPVRVRSDEAKAQIAALDVQAAPVVAYGQLLDRAVLDLVPGGWFNLHFSLLPAFRGAAPVQRAIEAGVTASGVSVFRLDEGMDTGPLAQVAPYTFGATETAGEALAGMAQLGAGVLVQVLDALESGRLTLTEQSSEGVSYAPKITARDLPVDPARPAEAVRAHIAAHAPTPGAFVEIGGVRVRLTGVGLEAAPDNMRLAPGELGVTKKHLFLGTATTPLEITRVVPAGKKEMAAADFARGARLSTGDRIDSEAAKENA